VSHAKDTPSARLDAAIVLHLAGRLHEAEAGYRDILRDAPDFLPATHYLGVALHQTGRRDEGRELVRASLRSPQPPADWHNTLGNMLVDAGRDDEAIAAFMAALEVDTGHALAWNNLGAVVLKRGQVADAILAFGNAIAINASFEDALHNLADALAQTGDERGAAYHRCQAYVLRPTPNKPRHMLGLAYRVLGRVDDAAHVYEDWLRDSPGDPVADHLLKACREDQATGRASNAYLEQYFDEFSATFEQKLSGLHYAVPDAIGEALRKLAPAPRSLRILDAGCGTGLCGPKLAPHARELVGVDLSSKSLELASAKGLYDALHPREIVDYMRACDERSFDLVVAADTLIYFGDITEFLQGARRVLAPGGWLIASFQTLAADNGFTIEPSGRFSHGRAYVLERHGAEGFTPVAIDPLDIRQELGLSVSGILLVARRD
jgi:predicted TPR repeat methyltransferase